MVPSRFDPCGHAFLPFGWTNAPDRSPAGQELGGGAAHAPPPDSRAAGRAIRALRVRPFGAILPFGPVRGQLSAHVSPRRLLTARASYPAGATIEPPRTSGRRCAIRASIPVCGTRVIRAASASAGGNASRSAKSHWTISSKVAARTLFRRAKTMSRKRRACPRERAPWRRLNRDRRLGDFRSAAVGRIRTGSDGVMGNGER